MAFDSLQAFWYMAGHGAYVWGAYGVTALMLVMLVWRPIARARHTRQQILAEVRRAQSDQAAVLLEVADAP